MTIFSTGYEKFISALNLRATGLGIPKQDIRFVEPQMVIIPDGSFLMGINQEQANHLLEYGASKEWLFREQPQHSVILSEYYISKYPITNYEYQFFIREAGYVSPRDWDGTQYPTLKRDHPVRFVTWDDAIVFCEWLSKKSEKDYQLPSEAQWEKAARGIDSRIYSWGNQFDPKLANTGEANINDTTPVG